MSTQVTGVADSDHLLTVLEVVQETADSGSLVLRPPAEVRERFRYAPGQFLTVKVPVCDGRVLSRCYSLSSDPELDDGLRITIKRVAGGQASNLLLDSVRAGDTLASLPPAGRFTPRTLDMDLLLLAGGSGITPVYSIARATLERGSGSIVLVFANRDEKSVIFAAQLRELSVRFPDRLLVIHLLESVEGLPTSERLAALLAPYGARDAAFVCGPEPFMDLAARALEHVGLSRDRVLTERFVSLSSAPAPMPQPDPGRDGPPARLTVTLDGARCEVEWPRSSTLLDTLLAQGLAAPYSCRQGECSACGCKVRQGEVRMARNEVLEDVDLADGWVLGCQSYPVTDNVEVTYDE